MARCSSDRVKDILKSATSVDVLGPLSDDIGKFDKGDAMHDELRWKDVALYSCQALQRIRATLFVTAAQLSDSHTEYARADGFAIVVVPNAWRGHWPGSPTSTGGRW